MKNDTFPITLLGDGISPLLSKELMEQLDIHDDERGKLKTVGYWGIPVSFSALCETKTWKKDRGYSECVGTTIWGRRTMGKCRQEGFQLEGRVSILGKTVRAFTSSQLFNLETDKLGKHKLIFVSTVFACTND